MFIPLINQDYYMLHFLPSDRSYLPSKGTPALPSFQDAKLEPQTFGIGLITVLMAGLMIYMFCLNLVQPHGLAPMIILIDQHPTTTTTAPSSLQNPENCQPHEVFRVSDRHCYQLQGE